MKPYPLIVKDLVSGLTKQQIKVFIHEQVKKKIKSKLGADTVACFKQYVIENIHKPLNVTPQISFTVFSVKTSFM